MECHAVLRFACCAVLCLTVLHSAALLTQLSGDIVGSPSSNLTDVDAFQMRVIYDAANMRQGLVQIPPTSILTLDPLYCSYSTLRVVLACKSATRHAATFRHFCQPPSSPISRQQAFQSSLPQGQASMGSSAIQSQAERQWPQDGSQGHRHHLLLPKALPQGNLSRYFDLACITAGLRCLAGQQDAWEDAWLVLNHALGNCAQEGQWLVSLQTLV